MTRLRWPVAAVACALAGAAQAQQGTAQMAWLSGCWAVVGAEAGSIEQWTAPAAGTLLGVARTVRQGATRSHEFMQIRDSAEGLVFIAKPSGKPEGSFAVERQAARSVAFHNPAHDFPQRIVYESPDDDTLDARIEGQINGNARTIRYPMKRIACPGGAAR
jgi:hypothetical protein